VPQTFAALAVTRRLSLRTCSNLGVGCRDRDRPAATVTLTRLKHAAAKSDSWSESAERNHAGSIKLQEETIDLLEAGLEALLENQPSLRAASFDSLRAEPGAEARVHARNKSESLMNCPPAARSDFESARMAEGATDAELTTAGLCNNERDISIGPGSSCWQSAPREAVLN